MSCYRLSTPFLKRFYTQKRRHSGVFLESVSFVIGFFWILGQAQNDEKGAPEWRDVLPRIVRMTAYLFNGHGIPCSGVCNFT
jgi:hypothetical protein